MAFSLAITDFISEYIEDAPSIKWPNDIYLGNKKIAGILIQNMVRNDTISSSILGVGININEDDFPLDVPNPISLLGLTNKDYNLLELQLHLSGCVEKRVGLLSENLSDEYLSKLFRKDEQAIFRIDGQMEEGIIRGVADDGKLELEFRGQRRFFGFRELEFII